MDWDCKNKIVEKFMVVESLITNCCRMKNKDQLKLQNIKLFDKQQRAVSLALRTWWI